MLAVVSLTWTVARIIPRLVVYNFQPVLSEQFVGEFRLHMRSVHLGLLLFA